MAGREPPGSDAGDVGSSGPDGAEPLPETMRAVVQDRYGPAAEVLRLGTLPVPNPADDEVLIRVRAASVHPDVWHVVTGFPAVLRLMGAGLRRPRRPTPGTDAAGVVVAVGSGVTRFRPGDAVFGETVRGHQWHNGGAYAEYATAPEEALAPKPASVGFAEAAATPTAGIIALHNLGYGQRIEPGHHVLVNGAAGGVGSIAVQIAKARGARVTGVDHPDKLELMRSLGADHVVDYTREDLTDRGERYDLVFDVASTLSLSRCKRVLAPDGIFIVIGHDHFGAGSGRWLGGLPAMIGLTVLSPFVKQLVPDVSMPDKRVAMAELHRLLEAGALTPVVDRTFPLDEVPEALRYLQDGRARGRIVIVP